MADVVRMEPTPLAVIFSMDVDPGFYVKLCNDATLFDTVHGGMFMRGQDEQSRNEVAQIVTALRESGSMDFEDGWIQLRVGMNDTVAFLMEKVGEAKREERYADQQRFEELKRREKIDGKYAVLRSALRDALGDKATEIAAAAAA